MFIRPDSISHKHITSRSALMGSKAKSFDGLTALLGRTGEARYRLAKGVGEDRREEEQKKEEERRVDEQRRVEVEEEKEEEERRRKMEKEEEEKKKREEKEERVSRRKGQGKFPGLSVSRFQIRDFSQNLPNSPKYHPSLYHPSLTNHELSPPAKSSLPRKSPK